MIQNLTKSGSFVGLLWVFLTKIKCMDGFKLHYTPKDLEKATGRSGRVIRARLRRRYPRSAGEHNSEWRLTYSQYQTEVSYWKTAKKK